MWKGKSAQQRTVNLCNQFLVIYINKKKNQLQKIGLDRKAMVYQTAVASIKKYPLPIICLQQLKSLYGVGELLSEQLLNVVKHHYKQFLKQTPPALSNLNNLQNNDEQGDQQQRQVSCTKSTGMADLYKNKRVGETKSQFATGDDTRSVFSCKSANNEKNYRPRANTHGAYAIIVLQRLKEEGFLDKERLLTELKGSFNIKITPKNYLGLLTNLCNAGYIQRDVQDYNFIRLTKKGEKEAQVLQTKTKQKQSCVKVKEVLYQFKRNQNMKPKTIINDKSVQNLVDYSEEGQMVLLIDTREMKDKQQQSFFQKRITQKYNMKCRTCNLPLGDFMWEYEGQILDYVVQRKKADDLISSMHDGRYKEQKYRLKNSSFNHVYYLLEGHLSSTFAKNQREVESAILKTRVKDGFKVVTVNNITQSAKFISFLTQQLRKKLEEQRYLVSLGSMEDVISSNGKANQLKVENIFGLSLKTIPGIGKNAVNEVLKHFKCFRELYDALSQLSNRFERVEFLRELLKGCGVRSTLPQLLVDVVFGGQNKAS